MNIFTKFHKDWTTIVDFLLIAKFWASAIFFVHPLYKNLLGPLEEGRGQKL